MVFIDNERRSSNSDSLASVRLFWSAKDFPGRWRWRAFSKEKYKKGFRAQKVLKGQPDSKLSFFENETLRQKIADRTNGQAVRTRPSHAQTNDACDTTSKLDCGRIGCSTKGMAVTDRDLTHLHHSLMIYNISNRLTWIWKMITMCPISNTYEKFRFQKLAFRTCVNSADTSGTYEARRSQILDW